MEDFRFERNAKGRKCTSKKRVFDAWAPWLILSGLIFIWGVPVFKKSLDQVSSPAFQVAHLHNLVQRAPPIAPPGTPEKPAKPEEAIYKLNWLSATGTGVFLAAILSGFFMGFGPAQLAKEYIRTLFRVRY